MMIRKLGIFAVVAALAVGCNPAPEDVDTGGSANSTEANADQAKEESKKEKAADEKRFKAGVSKEFLGVQVGIGEVVIQRDRIQVGLNYENKSGQAIHWYPDQEAKAVIGDMQLDSNLFMDDTGLTVGDISDGVKSDGVFTLRPSGKKTIDPKTVKEIKFSFGEMSSEDFMKDAKVEFTIPVK
ncbi:hypothetical protein [Kroppenstedtia eburnea]|uniref:DUF4352 domain-containing protein n=1 Tax=Kroppenstedtia eburnea TaxID=714067 RepID=A0A1N7KUL8_9BACL|nr:hypothetical protein [Kroppenstedtia eburnea]QKI82801.1 hypothetical protein GXN75_12800 [Kroppenstedtia eburnea]SIS65293.1 hypothetical protein SAMN05421790_103279 [Kroppenstedtia eburnea]